MLEFGFSVTCVILVCFGVLLSGITHKRNINKCKRNQKNQSRNRHLPQSIFPAFSSFFPSRNNRFIFLNAVSLPTFLACALEEKDFSLHKNLSPPRIIQIFFHTEHRYTTCSSFPFHRIRCKNLEFINFFRFIIVFANPANRHIIADFIVHFH